MSDSRSKSDHFAVEKVRLNDWIKKEVELEDGQGEEEFARENVTKKKRQNRKRKTDLSNTITNSITNTKRSTRNRESKRPKTDVTPEPEQQFNLQVLTEDDYIIAYITEEVDEQILQLPNEINYNQMADISTFPQIKDEPESSEPSTVSLNIHTCPFCSKGYILPEFLSRHITNEHPNCLLLPSVLPKPQESFPQAAKDRNTLGCSNICISSQKVARSLTDRSLDPTQLVIHHPTCPAIVPASQLSPVSGSTQTIQLKRTPKPREEAMIPISLPNSTTIVPSTKPKQSIVHQCPECLHVFSSAAYLSRHRFRIHSIVKQYVCRACEATFDEEVYHLKHLSQEHTGRNPLSCAACQLFFITAETTQAHLLSRVHTLPPFKCTVCRTIVPSRKAQKQHCVLHRSSTPVTIKECKEETLEELRSTAGPSLDNLALKLGNTGNKSDDTEVEEEGDEHADENDIIWLKLD